MAVELLNVGTKAPAINAKDQEGNTISLEDFKGSKVILYFYPKDDTPGCTKEACNLRDNYELLLEKGYKVIGVSVDDEKSHQKFINKYELPFPLIADTDHAVVNAYKVWVEKNMYGRKYMGTHRATYLIDEEGTITHAIKKVKSADATAQILEVTEGVKA